MTTSKAKTTRTRAASKPAQSAPAEAAAEAVEAATTETETATAPIIPGMPGFEAFKMSEIPFASSNFFDLSKFDASKIEVPAMVRDMAEKAVSQTKDGYAKAKAAAEESIDVVEETLETVRESTLEVQHKAMDNAKANTDAAYDFFKDMFSVKSMSEAVELQTSFARQQFEMLSSQSKDLSTLAGKAVTETLKPAKQAADKAMKAA
jgi:phasin